MSSSQSLVNADSLTNRICPMCLGATLRPRFVYDEPPPLETRFRLSLTNNYWRGMDRCDRCGHYLERFTGKEPDLYNGEYVSSTYGDSEQLRINFDRVNALPTDMSDNIGRVRYVNKFAEIYWPRDEIVFRERRLLDVGAGLGVFPYRMKELGWTCLAMDLDERLIEHHRNVVGVQSILGDLRRVSGIGRFGLITFNKVLEHIEDPVSVLSSARNFLEPRGLIYVELPDGEAAEVDGKDREEYLLGHIHVFSFASYALLAANARMSLICCERLREPSGKYTLRGFMRPELDEKHA